MILISRLLNRFNFLVIFIFFFSVNPSFAEKKLLMVTAEYCLYCQMWEEQIGEIYPKTDIAKNYPLEKMELDNFLENNTFGVEKTNITPTFIFFNNNTEIGRIVGFSDPEMFWWQVDGILER